MAVEFARGINALEGFHIHFSKFPLCRMSPKNKVSWKWPSANCQVAGLIFYN